MKKILIMMPILLMISCTNVHTPYIENKTDILDNKTDDVIEEELEILEPIPQPPIEPSKPVVPFSEIRVDPPTEIIMETEKTIYLSFDDGPSDRTIEILDILKEYDVKATFFVTCQQSYQMEEKYTDILQRIVDEGHEIGIHTYSHNYKEIYSSVEGFLTDFEKIFNHVKEHTDITPDIFRFAGGSKNAFNKNTSDDIIKEMTDRGFIYYDWNVSAEDSVGKLSEQQVISNIKNTMGKKTRAFILMHDSTYMTSTVEALDDIIEYGISQGYKFDVITNQTKSVKF